VIHGSDLLVLAGPSMDIDGPVFVYRWKDALKQSGDSLAAKKDLTTVVTVPFGVTKDHAEGLSLRRNQGSTVRTEPASRPISSDSGRSLHHSR
jgi:hypothetical protein